MIDIIIPGSKSISNRLLLIKAVSGLSFAIKNISDSDDTASLNNAFTALLNGAKKINVGHAGSTFRFLCSYLAAKENTNCILTGSEQLQKRPIEPLVKELKEMGAEIKFHSIDGFPPIEISGKKLNGGTVTIDSSISSQFISALLLISPLLENELCLKLRGDTVSRSYIHLTTELMKVFGKNVFWTQADTCIVKPGNYHFNESYFLNESDWSAASYFYSLYALHSTNEFCLNGLLKNSFQPDAIITQLFYQLGVKTQFNNKGVHLSRVPLTIKHLDFDFTDCPDIAQTIAITCVGLGITAELKGLQTLPFKETNRLKALQIELEKLGSKISIKENTLIIEKPHIQKIETVTINTYHDHRMAMSFAPLAAIYPNIHIENPEVVSKSFPQFWKELSKLI